MPGKTRSITLLLIAEVLVMSLWFVSAAVLSDMVAQTPMTPLRQAALSSAVQLGFVVGALVSAFLGLSDRYNPRNVFMISAFLAAAANAVLLLVTPGSVLAILARGATGALLAGVYPVGMKIVVGWGQKDRGFLVGALIGALALGSALPHFFALSGGAEWQLTVLIASAAAALAGVLVNFTSLGPFHAQAQRFDPRVITAAWTNRRVRLAYAGYLGHMWELYVMWAWIGVAAGVSYRMSMPAEAADTLAKWTAFIAISLGGVASLFAGKLADRIGKADVAMLAMVISGTAAIATAISFGGPVWLTLALIMIWGASIVPDSAQFSALVADASPPDQAGSLMTLQTALGFLLTFFTVQATPMLVAAFCGLHIHPA